MGVGVGGKWRVHNRECADLVRAHNLVDRGDALGSRKWVRSDSRQCATVHTGEEENAGHSGHYRELLSTYRILCSYNSGIVGLSRSTTERRKGLETGTRIGEGANA